MAVTVLALVVGVALLAYAADQFVLGAARVALIRNISPLVVGVVIMGFGTSAPELLVSSIAAAGGNPEIAVGNIVGSNIANLSLLLGIGAIIIPLAAAITRGLSQNVIKFGLNDLPSPLTAALVSSTMGLVTRR